MLVGIPRALVTNKQKRAGVKPLTTFGRDVQTLASPHQVELHKNEVCDWGGGGGEHWGNPQIGASISIQYSESDANRRVLQLFASTKTIKECHLTGYNNPVRTSQETHYFTATGPSRLMLRLRFPRR
jgi:hypothetical protein